MKNSIADRVDANSGVSSIFVLIDKEMLVQLEFELYEMQKKLCNVILLLPKAIAMLLANLNIKILSLENLNIFRPVDKGGRKELTMNKEVTKTLNDALTVKKRNKKMISVGKDGNMFVEPAMSGGVSNEMAAYIITEFALVVVDKDGRAERFTQDNMPNCQIFISFNEVKAVGKIKRDTEPDGSIAMAFMLWKLDASDWFYSLFLNSRDDQVFDIMYWCSRWSTQENVNVELQLFKLLREMVKSPVACDIIVDNSAFALLENRGVQADEQKE